jgi:hypothetical protein
LEASDENKGPKKIRINISRGNGKNTTRNRRKLIQEKGRRPMEGS